MLRSRSRPAHLRLAAGLVRAGRPSAGLVAAVGLLLAPAPALAKVVRVVVTSRDTILGRKAFGKAGAYEKIAGRVYFTFDPSNPADARIADLALAPRDADGKVEAWADFMVLQPVDPARRSGVSLLEVSNRGGKAALAYFDRAASSLDPSRARDFGDGFLLRRGYTIVWVGWEFDVPPDPALLLRLHVPRATNPDGSPLRGRVRSDWVVENPTRTLSIGHRSQVGYPVTDTATREAYLTVRDDRDAPRRLVPRSAWAFARETKGGAVVGDSTHIFMKAGFTPGKIYELVYPSQNPPIVGLGLAAVRDMIAYQKYDPHSLFPAKWGIAEGISQTGRFLRHFLYQGFNVDEEGRKAFDGILAMAAGAGRGSFDHRFGQPSRDAHRFSAFFYPTDLFPFTGRVERDPLTGREDGLLAHTPPEDLPKVFYTNSGYEYWGRAASLIHTSADGSTDVPPLPNVRLYHFAGGQHFVDRFPPGTDRFPEAPRGLISKPGQPAAWRGDPLDYHPNLRALLVRLTEWIVDGREPPPSAIPRIADGTLVPVETAARAFPDIPGLGFPKVTEVAYRADYGPRWAEGIVDFQPPRLGPAFPALVPTTDSLGNERDGIRNVEVRAPLATYAPWSLRTGMPGPQDELADFRGTFIPLPWDEADRARTGDPRPAVSELYGSRAAYLRKAAAAADSLVREGFLLREDSSYVVGRAGAIWDWMAKRAAAREGGAGGGQPSAAGPRRS
ncbi:MAG: alpha/beta hydrolase domain-containing protein [Candidatus Palauibacterales bacterium]|nr:alpha/beta hydrolase domain-containing protein [Candidatus Palauibacterales bacterium]